MNNKDEIVIKDPLYIVCVFIWLSAATYPSFTSKNLKFLVPILVPTEDDDEEEDAEGEEEDEDEDKDEGEDENGDEDGDDEDRNSHGCRHDCHHHHLMPTWVRQNCWNRFSKTPFS